jgi:hypothetical protein
MMSISIVILNAYLCKSIKKARHAPPTKSSNRVPVLHSSDYLSVDVTEVADSLGCVPVCIVSFGTIAAACTALMYKALKKEQNNARNVIRMSLSSNLLSFFNILFCPSDRSIGSKVIFLKIFRITEQIPCHEVDLV